MDALLPSLDPAFTVELPAPPELNANSDIDLNIDNGNATEMACLQDAVVSPASDGDQGGAEAEVVVKFDDETNKLKNKEVDDFEVKKMPTSESSSEDNITSNNIEDPTPQLDEGDEEVNLDNITSGTNDFDENSQAVKLCVDSIVNEVVESIQDNEESSDQKEEEMDVNNPSFIDSDEYDEDYLKSTIRDCRIVLDKKVVPRYLATQRKRKKRLADRLAAQRAEEEPPLPVVVDRTARLRHRETAPPPSKLPLLTRLVCKECHESFLEARVLRFHFRAKHVDVLDDIISMCGHVRQYILCPLCKETFRTKVDFNSHMSALHSMSRWIFEGFDCYDEQLLGDVVAEYLRKRIGKKETVKVKETVNAVNIPKCNICSKTFATERGVVNHKTQVHPNDYNGPVSSSTAAVAQVSSATPVQHKTPVAGPKSARFRQVAQPQQSSKTLLQISQTPQQALKCPQQTIKTPQQASKTPNPAAKAFVCEWCRDRLKTTEQLHTHLRSKHSVPENFSAEGCDLPDFFTAMEHHFTVEEKEENSYECVSCKETFLEKVGLLEHFSGEHLRSKVVGMEIKLQCGICNHHDSDVRNLHDHMWNDHANQKLEDMVIRVKDVRSSHRCGEECKLLWKKPVVSVEAAPRALKRPSSEVKAMPRSAKERRVEKPLDLQVSEDDEKIMRMMEEVEDKKLRDQEEKSKIKRKEAAERRKREEEEKKEKRREIDRKRYQDKKKAQQEAGRESENSGDFLQEEELVNSPSRHSEKSEDTRSNDSGSKNSLKHKTTRCLLCLLPCEDIKKHIAEVHNTSLDNVKRNIKSRSVSLEKQPSVPVLSPPSPVKRPQTARPSVSKRSSLPSALATPPVVRCPSCHVQFPDIIGMMNHRIHCSIAEMKKGTPSPAKKKPSPPKISSPPLTSVMPSLEPSTAAVTKKAQFVLMDEEEPQQQSSFKCLSCKTSYSSVGEWQAHIQEFHLNELCCEQCPASFKDELALSKHISRAHKNVTYPCIVCGAQFSIKKAFLQHISQQHQISKSKFNGITLANIDQVEKMFADVGYFKNQEGTSSSSSVFRTVLPKPKPRQKPLERKIKVENTELPVLYQCELCNACYSSPLEMKEHMQFVH